VISVVLAALWTNTAQVESIAASGTSLWAATAGGLEEYRLPARTRTLYTTEQGLDSNVVHEVWADDGIVRVRTERSVCVLREDRFSCAEAIGFMEPIPSAAPRVHGARETARQRFVGSTVVATAGAGVWLDDGRLTPAGQICTNHVQALAEFRGQLWVGGFDGGLCVL